MQGDAWLALRMPTSTCKAIAVQRGAGGDELGSVRRQECPMELPRDLGTFAYRSDSRRCSLHPMSEKQKRWAKRVGFGLVVAGAAGLAVASRSRSDSASSLSSVSALSDAAGEILCSDGWSSPSPCSKQGVCSHHGGIAA